MNKIVYTIILSIVLVGCSSLGKKPSNVVVSADRIVVCSNPPSADAVVMREVLPTVIQDENGLYWVGISPKHYGNLSINIQGMLQHIKQQKAIIKYYQECK